ncbi:hypothetical protein DSUL_20248 [Desulfovibrionales bacterium]
MLSDIFCAILIFFIKIGTLASGLARKLVGVLGCLTTAQESSIFSGVTVLLLETVILALANFELYTKK